MGDPDAPAGRFQGFQKVLPDDAAEETEALAKLDRRACDRPLIDHSVTAAADQRDSATVLLRSELKREIARRPSA